MLRRAHSSMLILLVIIICCLWIAIFRQGSSARKYEDEIQKLKSQLQESDLNSLIKSNEVLQLKDRLASEQQKFLPISNNYNLLSNTTAQSADMSLSNRIHAPSIQNYLPHLKKKPQALIPSLKIGKNKLGATIVVGIPTVKRSKESYLVKTLGSLFNSMSDEEKEITIVVVFIAETNIKFIKDTAKILSDKFSQYIASGLLEMIAPAADYYPDLTHLPLTLGDNIQRVRWRTKQNLDYAYLMMYVMNKGVYYVQLEDDVISAPNCISKMKNFAMKQRNQQWFVLLFSQLGFIGKLFRTENLAYMVNYMLMFHKDQPCDWLLDHILYSKVCSIDKSMRHCSLQKQKLSKRFRPSLFQHVGKHSSLAGKVQPLKDKSFRMGNLFVAHNNPPAKIKTTIKHHQSYSIEFAYNGKGMFWGVKPIKGDFIDIQLLKPVELRR